MAYDRAKKYYGLSNLLNMPPFDENDQTFQLFLYQKTIEPLHCYLPTYVPKVAQIQVQTVNHEAKSIADQQIKLLYILLPQFQ